MNMTRLLTNVHNWTFIMNDSRIKFNIQRWCFWILIRSMFVEQSSCSFSLMKFDFEHSQNVQFRRQIIREVLCIWRSLNLFFHNFSNKRLNRLVEATKTQIKNHQNLHHRSSLYLHRSKIWISTSSMNLYCNAKSMKSNEYMKNAKNVKEKLSFVIFYFKSWSLSTFASKRMQSYTSHFVLSLQTFYASMSLFDQKLILLSK